LIKADKVEQTFRDEQIDFFDIKKCIDYSRCSPKVSNHEIQKRIRKTLKPQIYLFKWIKQAQKDVFFRTIDGDGIQ
jgi:hypothetical protein